MIPSNNIVIQQAWVVTDIEEAAQKWSSALNIGPFYMAEYSPAVFSSIEYRGAPGKLHIQTAIAYSGDIQIELVKPIGSSPTAYSDIFAEGQTGFHHNCYWSDDFVADLKHYSDQGFIIANQGQVIGNGPRFAYIDAFDTLGCMIELLERTPATEQNFKAWHDSSKVWTPDQELIVKL